MRYVYYVCHLLYTPYKVYASHICSLIALQPQAPRWRLRMENQPTLPQAPSHL